MDCMKNGTDCLLAQPGTHSGPHECRVERPRGGQGLRGRGLVGGSTLSDAK